MGGIANLDILRPGNRRAGIFQIHRIEHSGAILALVAARPVVIAMRTGADDIAVGQEAAIGGGIGLLGDPHIQEAVLPQLPGEMQGEFAVLRRRRTPKIVPAEAELLAQIFLRQVPFGGIGGSRHALFLRRQLDGRAMFIGGADRQGLIASRPAETGEDIGRQHRAHQVSQMLDAGDVRQGGGDQNALHGLLLSGVESVCRTEWVRAPTYRVRGLGPSAI